MITVAWYLVVSCCRHNAKLIVLFINNKTQTKMWHNFICCVPCEFKIHAHLHLYVNKMSRLWIYYSYWMDYKHDNDRRKNVEIPNMFITERPNLLFPLAILYAFNCGDRSFWSFNKNFIIPPRVYVKLNGNNERGGKKEEKTSHDD